VFLIEGEKELLHAMRAQVSLEAILYCPELVRGNRKLNNPEEINRRAGHTVRVEQINEAVYDKIAYRGRVQGIIAMAYIPKIVVDQIKLSSQPLILVVQGVEKPGNLGALLRTADGAGVELVIVLQDEGGVDIYNPNVVRASLGAIFTVPVVVMTSRQVEDFLTAIKVPMVLTTPEAQKDYTLVDYTGAVAVVLGSEKEGLPEQWLQNKANQISIPMCGQMDSLNVSCSGAIILYEAVRQRK